MKKIIWPGLVAGLVTLVLGMAVSYLSMLVPSVAVDYSSAGIMRPWSDPLMSLFFVSPFVQSVILAWVWNKTKSVFSGAGNNGVKFGVAAWLVATVPGMIISYSSFPLSFWTVFSWLVSGLVTMIATGMIFAKMNR